MSARACPSTTVTGLLEAIEDGSIASYYYERWTRSTGGRVEWVGTVLGRLVDRGLVVWPASGVEDATMTEYGGRYLAWLRAGRRGKKPEAGT